MHAQQQAPYLSAYLHARALFFVLFFYVCVSQPEPPFSRLSAVYIKLDLSIIPSGLPPERECSPNCDRPFILTIDIQQNPVSYVATFDKNRRAQSAGMLNPIICGKKMKARTGGAEGTTPVTTACPKDR